MGVACGGSSTRRLQHAATPARGDSSTRHIIALSLWSSKYVRPARRPAGGATAARATAARAGGGGRWRRRQPSCASTREHTVEQAVKVQRERRVRQRLSRAAEALGGLHGRAIKRAPGGQRTVPMAVPTQVPMILSHPEPVARPAHADHTSTGLRWQDESGERRACGQPLRAVERAAHQRAVCMSRMRRREEARPGRSPPCATDSNKSPRAEDVMHCHQAPGTYRGRS